MTRSELAPATESVADESSLSLAPKVKLIQNSSSLNGLLDLTPGIDP